MSKKKSKKAATKNGAAQPRKAVPKKDNGISPVQAEILAAALAREDKSIFPMPERLNSLVQKKLAQVLEKKGLAEYDSDDVLVLSEFGIEKARKLSDCTDSETPSDGQQSTPEAPTSERQTDESRPSASGASIPGTANSENPDIVFGTTGRINKKATTFKLVSRPDGATLEELCETLAWLEKSVRGEISTLRKEKGVNIVYEEVDGRKLYRVKKQTPEQAAA